MNRGYSKKIEGNIKSINKEQSDNITVAINTNIPSEADKIQKEDNIAFEEFQKMYAGVIDLKCKQDYGDCNDENLRYDTAKELFLQSKNYILTGDEYKPKEDLVQDNKEKKTESKEDDIELPSSANGTAEKEIQDMLDRARTKEFDTGIDFNENKLNEDINSENSIIIPTGLSDNKSEDVLNSVLGQLSDGIWENSSRMDKYWKYAEIIKDGSELCIKVNNVNDYSNGFKDMNAAQISRWFANKVKQIVQEEDLKWDRTNTDKAHYLNRNADVTVEDAYRVYDQLLGRTQRITEENENEYQYMLLDRLKNDCEYFLGYGNRYEKHLWAGNVDDQIAEMKKIWNNLKEKPEWLSMEDIENYERKMKGEETNESKSIENKIESIDDNTKNEILSNIKKLNLIQLEEYIKSLKDEKLKEELLHQFNYMIDVAKPTKAGTNWVKNGVYKTAEQYFDEIKKTEDKKITESINIEASSYDELEEVINDLYDNEEIDDDAYDEIVDIIAKDRRRCYNYIRRRSKVTNTDYKDEIGIEEDNVTATIKNIIERFNLNENREIKLNEAKLEESTKCDICGKENITGQYCIDNFNICNDCGKTYTLAEIENKLNISKEDNKLEEKIKLSDEEIAELRRRVTEVVKRFQKFKSEEDLEKYIDEFMPMWIEMQENLGAHVIPSEDENKNLTEDSEKYDTMAFAQLLPMSFTDMVDNDIYDFIEEDEDDSTPEEIAEYFINSFKENISKEDADEFNDELAIQYIKYKLDNYDKESNTDLDEAKENDLSKDLYQDEADRRILARLRHLDIYLEELQDAMKNNDDNMIAVNKSKIKSNIEYLIPSLNIKDGVEGLIKYLTETNFDFENRFKEFAHLLQDLDKEVKTESDINESTYPAIKKIHNDKLSEYAIKFGDKYMRVVEIPFHSGEDCVKLVDNIEDATIGRNYWEILGILHKAEELGFNIDGFDIEEIGQDLNESKEIKTENNDNEKEPINIFSEDSEEYKRLQKACDLLNEKTNENAEFFIKDIYFDYGQKWKWTTIITKDLTTGTTWQTLNPRQQEEIINGKDLNNIVDNVLSSSLYKNLKLDTVNESLDEGKDSQSKRDELLNRLEDPKLEYLAYFADNLDKIEKIIDNCDNKAKCKKYKEVLRSARAFNAGRNNRNN